MLEFGEPNVKDEILKLLAEKPRLEAKKIHSVVSRQLPVTYQAIHKALADLNNQKIVQKDPAGKYSLSPVWLRHVKQFVDTALPHADPEAVTDYRIVHLDSVSAVDDFLVKFGARHYKKGRTLCLNWSHFWIPLFENQRTYAAMKQMVLTSKSYGITPSTTPIDRWCAAYWKKLGVNEKTGVGYAGLDFLTYADHFVQIFYPRDLRDKLDRYYEKAKTIRQLDLDGLYEHVFRKKTNIPVLIIHDPALARHVENEVKGLF